MIWVLALSLAACTDGPTDTGVIDTQVEDTSSEGLAPPEGDPASVELAGECPMESHIGAFTVADYGDYTIAEGSVSDAVVPVTVLTPGVAAGDCQLFKRENPFCEGGCQSDETCGLDGVCVPYPSSLNVGQVTIAGLVRDVLMDPIQPGDKYFDTSLPQPAAVSGELIQLRVQESEHGNFDLHGISVEPLVLPPSTLVLEEGQDLSVNWTASPGRARVELRLSIDQHGSSPSTLVCDFEDDGEGLVPAAAINALVVAGVTGFPNGSLSRRTVDQAQTDPGCVDLVTQSRRNPEVRVAGFIPCTDDDQCPEGLSCNLAIEICE